MAATSVLGASVEAVLNETNTRYVFNPHLESRADDQLVVCTKEEKARTWLRRCRSRQELHSDQPRAIHARHQARWYHCSRCRC